MNKINLLLIDPFFSKTLIAHFKSRDFYDNEIFMQNDSIITSNVQSTMVTKKDLSFKSYIWTQLPDTLVRSKIIKKTPKSIS